MGCKRSWLNEGEMDAVGDSTPALEDWLSGLLRSPTSAGVVVERLR